MLLEGVLAAVVVLSVMLGAAQRFGWLPAGPVAQAAQDRADRAEDELKRANDELAILRARTDLQPLIDIAAKMLETQGTVLEKLTDLNGGLKASAEAHAETSKALRTTSEAIKYLATRTETTP